MRLHVMAGDRCRRAERKGLRARPTVEDEVTAMQDDRGSLSTAKRTEAAMARH